MMENITLRFESGGLPLYEQIYRWFVTEMESGRLPEGERLPSKRALQAHLGVSRSTVEAAYGMLTAEGYLRAAPRSGYYVSADAPRARVQVAGTDVADGRDLASADGRAGSDAMSPVADALRPAAAGGRDSVFMDRRTGSDAMPPVADALRPAAAGGRAGSVFVPPFPAVSPAAADERSVPAAVDFSTGAVDTAAFPYASWAKLNREVLYRNPDLLQKGDSRGDLSLRAALCAFLREWRGVRCTPEQVLVGAGMEYLLEALVQLLPPARTWALEDPGYGAVRRVLENSGRPRVFVPLDADGISLDALTRSGADVAYITPSHQFPMGVTMPIGRRSRLLEWAEAGDRLLIEDDYDSEFRYRSRPVPALQGLDRSGRVIYVGTFSRSIAPGIRVAYLVLPERLLPAFREKLGWAASTVSRFEQQTLRRFLEEGLFARHLRRMNALYRRKQQTLLDALARALPEGRVTGSQAGLHFLLTVPGADERALVARAAQAGIRVRGLSGYAQKTTVPGGTVVLGFAGLRPEDIERDAAALAAAWRD